MVICETRLFCSVLAALGGSCHMTFQANSLYLLSTVEEKWDKKIHDALQQECRRQDGRELEPSAAILDSQSVKTTEKGGFLDMTLTNMSRDANDISWWTQWALLLLLL